MQYLATRIFQQIVESNRVSSTEKRPLASSVRLPPPIALRLAVTPHANATCFRLRAGTDMSKQLDASAIADAVKKEIDRQHTDIDYDSLSKEELEKAVKQIQDRLALMQGVMDKRGDKPVSEPSIAEKVTGKFLTSSLCSCLVGQVICSHLAALSMAVYVLGNTHKLLKNSMSDEARWQLVTSGQRRMEKMAIPFDTVYGHGGGLTDGNDSTKVFHTSLLLAC